MSIGFTIPFSISTGSVGYFETTADPLSAVRENIKSLLLTNWGERPNRYYLGCNFKEFLFENLSKAELRGKIGERVLDQVGTWLPFVTVQSLNILLTEDDPNIPENALRVSIKFNINSAPDAASRLEIVVTQ